VAIQNVFIIYKVKFHLVGVLTHNSFWWEEYRKCFRWDE